MIIIGISCFYHDSAAAIIVDGKIIAAAQEERYTRIKHDSAFPKNSIEYCLDEVGINLSDVDYIVFYEKPFVKFERLLETYLAFAPKGFKSFAKAIPVWIKDKLFAKRNIHKELMEIRGADKKDLPILLFSKHHLSHAASAFYPSKFDKAIVLCLDGVGEWDTSSVWIGEENKIKKIWSTKFPHSLGLLYSAFTFYAGFKVNSGEYKLMGLAPYGEPIYKKLILDNLIDIKDDGSFRLDMSYFDFATGLKMTNKKFNNLFGGEPRQPESKITQKQMDIAKSIQVVTEEVILKIVNYTYEEHEVENLCLAGGVALNCVANGRINRESKFKNLWIQPASGDAGGALGAALLVWYEFLDNKRNPSNEDSMSGSYLGKEFSDSEVENYLDNIGAKYERLDEDDLVQQVALEIKNNNVIGWFNGRMEFGPRALGNRSLLGNPMDPEMQKTMNLKIKYRESFRPFAPIIKADKVNEWFDLDIESPYMLLVDNVKKEKLIINSNNNSDLFGIDKLNLARSVIPAVTHVDNSARIQTLNKNVNPKFYKLLTKFEELTNCPILINTSFNIRGEPIVNSLEDAYRCFMGTGINILVINNFILYKDKQSKFFDNSKFDNKKNLD